MADLSALLDRLEALLEELDGWEPPVRDAALELLDGVDALHRSALRRLGELLGPETVAQLRAEDPAVGWLFDAYGVGVDELALARQAVASVQPYVDAHGGQVEVRAVSDGVVRVRLSGACSGCTGSAVTLREGVERALREGFPGFARLEVDPDDGPVHAPPGPTLVQVGRRPA